MTTTSLVPVGGFGLSMQGLNDDLREYTRELFSCFWEVFSADRQRERAVFWIDDRRGQLVVRHVRNLKRQHILQDHLIARVSQNLDCVRVAIGNFAEGCYMTPIRWELYSDFALSQQIACGRFDHHDLLPEFTNTEQLLTLPVPPVGDWDFDNISLTHRCSTCRGIYNPNSIIYIPHETCRQCQKTPDSVESHRILRRMLLKYKSRQAKLSVLSSHQSGGEFAVQSFLDPAANSVMYWWVISGGIDITIKYLGADFMETLRSLYRDSLFGAMASSHLRQEFLKHLRDIDSHDWELFLAQISKWGQVFDGRSSAGEGREQLPTTSIDFVRQILPGFINQVILGHASNQLSREAIPVQKG